VLVDLLAPVVVVVVLRMEELVKLVVLVENGQPQVEAQAIVEMVVG